MCSFSFDKVLIAFSSVRIKMKHCMHSFLLLPPVSRFPFISIEIFEFTSSLGLSSRKTLRASILHRQHWIGYLSSLLSSYHKPYFASRMIFKLALGIICIAMLHQSLVDTSNNIVSKRSYKISHEISSYPATPPKKSLYFDYIFKRPLGQFLLHHDTRLSRHRRHNEVTDLHEKVDDHEKETDYDDAANDTDELGDIAYSEKHLIFTDPFDESPKGFLPWLKVYFEILEETKLGCDFDINNTNVTNNTRRFRDERIRYRGNASEGEPCGYLHGSHNLTRCKLFEDEKCTKPTFLFCTFADHLTNRSFRICRKSMLLSDLQDLRVFKHVDNSTGCLLNYVRSRDIPVALQGDLTYKQTCDPAGLNHNDRCKWYTQASMFNNDVNHIDKPSCLKPTHLYCDPLLRICLCGQDQDPNQFQNDKTSHKCYIRPTYDLVEGYECAPGSSPAKVSAGHTGFHICKCKAPFYGPHFNSVDPDWWKCSASSSSPYALFLIFAVIGTIICQLSVTG